MEGIGYVSLFVPLISSWVVGKKMSSECQFVSLLQRIINSADCLGFSARVNRQNNSTQLFTSTKLIFKKIKISFEMNFFFWGFLRSQNIGLHFRRLASELTVVWARRSSASASLSSDRFLLAPMVPPASNWPMILWAGVRRSAYGPMASSPCGWCGSESCEVRHGGVNWAGGVGSAPVGVDGGPPFGVCRWFLMQFQ